MSQKATKEQMPALIAEIANRSRNVENLTAITKFLNRVTLVGSEAKELGLGMAWVETILQNENARIAEIKAQLPDHDTEIALGPDQPADAPTVPPEGGAEPGKPEPAAGDASAIAVGGMEMSKGSPVLGAV